MWQDKSNGGEKKKQDDNNECPFITDEREWNENYETHVREGREMIGERERGELTFLSCAEMETPSQQGFLDPLSAIAAESEKASALSLDVSDGAEALAAADVMDRPTPSPTPSRQAADGSEDMDLAVDFDKDEPTDSSSIWSPEVIFIVVGGSTSRN